MLNMESLKAEALSICNSINVPFFSDLKELITMVELFKKEYKEYMSEEKAIVSVIGVVKAGKSSFLNCLLFEGKNLLPKAITPMTATLTIMEFGKENRAEIIYFTKDEFNLLAEEIKKSGSEEEKRMLSSLRRELSKKGRKEVLTASNPQELLIKLSDFVSSERSISYIVKEINVKINLPVFEGLKIVDTPGLNDPVVSRSQKTLDFIRKSHVVFHLSRTSQFLESEDLKILARYGTENIQRLYVVGSRYDEALKELRFQGREKKTRSKNLLDRLKRKEKKEIQPTEIDGFIKDLEGKCLNRITQIGIKGFSTTNFSLFSALFFKAGKNMLDVEEKEIFENFLKDTKFTFTRSYLDYSGINELKNKLNEVKKEHKEIVYDGKRKFVQKRRESIKKKVRDISGRINSLRAESNRTLLILQRFLETIKEKHPLLEKSLSEKMEDIKRNYISITDKALDHIAEGISRLNVVTDIEIVEKEKEIYRTKTVRKWCGFSKDEYLIKETVIELEEVPYIDVDVSIQKARDVIRKAIRTYRKRLYDLGVNKQNLKENVKTLVEGFIDELFTVIGNEFKDSIEDFRRTKKSLLTEIDRAIDSLSFPDPLNVKFPEEEFRRALGTVGVNDADKVYKQLLNFVLRGLKRDVEVKRKEFLHNISKLQAQVLQTVKSVINDYYKSVEKLLDNRLEVEKKLERLLVLLSLLEQNFETQVKELQKIKI